MERKKYFLVQGAEATRLQLTRTVVLTRISSSLSSSTFSLLSYSLSWLDSGDSGDVVESDSVKDDSISESQTDEVRRSWDAGAVESEEYDDEDEDDDGDKKEASNEEATGDTSLSKTSFSDEKESLLAILSTLVLF